MVICFRKALHGLHSPPLPLPSAANTTKMALAEKTDRRVSSKVRRVYSDETEALSLSPLVPGIMALVVDRRTLERKHGPFLRPKH